jgi:hypothetical protein
MQSPVVKRIPLPFPFNLLPSPLNGFNVTVPSGPHAYSTKTWVGKTTQGVTPEMAFQALRGRATPLQGGVSVSDGDMTDIPGFGRVRHIVDADRRTIVNTTMPEHRLHPGNVLRSIVQEGDDLFVVTQGYGTGVWPGPNEVAGPRLWPAVDIGIRNELNPQSPLGYPMDEMNAVAGSRNPARSDTHGSVSGNGISPIQSASWTPFSSIDGATGMTGATGKPNGAGGLLGLLHEAMRQGELQPDAGLDPNPQSAPAQAAAIQSTQPIRRLVRMRVGDDTRPLNPASPPRADLVNDEGEPLRRRMMPIFDTRR